ncbi:hypothetical protein QFC20_000655 [Naganishia adeliensis]|uniref:Uncharacterized protein n=1 Tax=Naganishia adeliensis TaxID=92952 RepID=A0ACC2WZH1_9TREE|nr:hypothetical protein QFC20_000655 [Naganishia adeliensis]
MMPFISLSLLYRRRVTLVFVLLSALAFTFLATDLRKSYDETAARGYRVFDKVRNFGAGQIPDAFRPSTYLGTTTVKEPTTREEWESFAATVEVSVIPVFLHRSHSTQYATDWDDLPPNIKAFKEWEFARGMVYQGTGERTKRFLEKARSGRGVVVSVVGGSVSKGRGLPVHEDLQPKDPESTSHSHDKRSLAEDWHIDHRHSVSQNLYNPLNVHYQIFQFINRTFPAIPHSLGGLAGSEYRGENVVSITIPVPLCVVYSLAEYSPCPGSSINGAQGGVGSDYFAGCWKEHIPEDSDLDPSILEMDSQPAVLNLHASSLHIDVAAYYDTPVISIRDIVLPRILNDGTRRTSPGGGAGVGLEIVKWFRNVPEEELVKGDAKNVYVAETDSWVDLMHISQHGHSLLAEMAIHYLQLQIQLLSPFDVHGADSDSYESVASTNSTSDSNETAEHQETPPKPVLTDIPGHAAN